jgi:hypothetical protein
MEELSISLKLPNIKLVDGSSGGGSVTVNILENLNKLC